MIYWWRVRDSTSPPHEISRISQVWPCLRRPRTAPQSGFASIGVNGFRRSETASDRRGEAAPGCQVHLLRLHPFLFGGHRQLALENFALRHRLAVYKRTVTRPRLCRTDRQGRTRRTANRAAGARHDHLDSRSRSPASSLRPPGGVVQHRLVFTATNAPLRSSLLSLRPSSAENLVSPGKPDSRRMPTLLP